MTPLLWVLGSLIIVFAIAIIAVVLLQEGRRHGVAGAISGGADTFMSKNKARTIDAFLSRWTKFITIAFFVLVIVALVISVLATSSSDGGNNIDTTSTFDVGITDYE